MLQADPWRKTLVDNLDGDVPVKLGRPQLWQVLTQNDSSERAVSCRAYFGRVTSRSLARKHVLCRTSRCEQRDATRLVRRGDVVGTRFVARRSGE